MKSYVSTRLGVFSRIIEAWNLYLIHSQRTEETAKKMLDQARETDLKITSLLGKPVNGLKMLELGPGQQLVQMTYFAPRNEVVGIDLDVVEQHFTVKGCLRMIRQNGWLRTCKTIVRVFSGIDRKMRKEVMLQLGLKTVPVLKVLQMDATKTDFQDNEFDVVFSRAVFEHLPDVDAVVTEMRRVIKPGGVLAITFHLYTSDSGCHDTRIFAGQREGLPYWSHLRSEYELAVRPNSYLNKLRLVDWRRIFESRLPGCKIDALQDASQLERAELERLRSQGILTSYSDEELLTVTVEVIWQKPTQFSGPQDMI